MFFCNNAKTESSVSTCCLHVVYMSPTCRLQVPVPDPSIYVESIKNVFRNQRFSCVFIKWKKRLQRVPTCPKRAHFGGSKWSHFCIVLDRCEAKALNNGRKSAGASEKKSSLALANFFLARARTLSAVRSTVGVQTLQKGSHSLISEHGVGAL